MMRRMLSAVALAVTLATVPTHAADNSSSSYYETSVSWIFGGVQWFVGLFGYCFTTVDGGNVCMK